MSHFQVFELPSHTDSRGSLTVLEGVLPFAFIRSYWNQAADIEKIAHVVEQFGAAIGH